MRPARLPKKNEIGTAEAKAQLAMMLAAMRPEKLAEVTVDSLARMNRSPRSWIEARLAEARQGRMTP